MEYDSHVGVNQIIKNMKDKKILDTKKVSDKWHTFGELYIQRLMLFSVICNQNKEIAWKSKKHYDEKNDPMFNGDFIAGLMTPKGPATFHFKLEYWDLFDIREIPNAPKYDGYSSIEALERILSILSNDKKIK